MRHSFSRGQHAYRVTVDETVEDAEELRFRSQREAAAFLQRESHAAGAMRGYRRVLEAARTGADVGRLSDQEVLLRLGGLMAQRRVRLHEAQREHLAYTDWTPAEDEPSAIGPDKGFGIVGELVVAEVPLYDVDLTSNEPPLIDVGVELGPLPGEDNDADAVDAGAQAVALQAAAASGAPFCEECAKAKAAAAAAQAADDAAGASEEEAKDESVAALDAPAQAAALRGAAASGVPFCEECEKAKAAAAAAAA